MKTQWWRMLVALVVLGSPAQALCAGDGSGSASVPANAAAPALPSPEALGLSFVDGSTSTVIVERDGKEYLVDLVSHQIREVEAAASSASSGSPTGTATPALASAAPAAQAAPPVQKPAERKPDVYEPGDDFIFSLPTGRRLERHGFYVNFNHRFAYNTAFAGPARAHVLFGLDDFSLSSFGFRYGVTKKVSVEIYRSPSLLGRPIQLSAGYNLWDEHDGDLFNAAFRFSVEGQNDFSRNFTYDFEGMFSRSLSSRAQIYFVPTVSLHDHPLLQDQGRLRDPLPTQQCGAMFAKGTNPALNLHPCANTFSLGIAGSLDIRPTVALVAEVIPTLANGTELGIHRPAYSFGIQKKIWRHAFTFGFSNSPGTTVSQRAGTRATLLSSPSADTPGGLFVGFDLTRQIY